ncbi:uncharacterized protein NECHADRAFT_84398 [Fusarium vanettenii 77-13-4]|uniref:Ubiquitin 3 binding protein But2 C-terminal domain-containing protein n=1 Tax=Fusarium vanettenii (strain ATCC MYA-4622 / CBS 123669 / FGSC 9596 / NRRL 45880 / 77-13-4) TaxID=660122 RepID=C7ZD00_FUSV7|nr:uncharacterized protein NECHADRAFT_84398 [Fusarium vanettenii 77-13-4]EEU38133.1 hypothetical protein NECHADRAFT_84398 [Fusarium vanettenii 77-13-4]
MHTSYLASAFVAVASLFSGSSAGLCRPSSSLLSSDTATVPSSTTEIASTTTDVTSSSNAASPTTTEVASTDVSSSTSDAPSSTSSLPEPITTFDLKGANSELEAVNGQSLSYRQQSGYSLFLVVPDSVADQYGPGEFHLEEGTNRLMVGDFHVFASSFSTSYSLTGYMQHIKSPYSVFISCVPPTARGQRLECMVEGTSRTEFKVALAEFTNGHSLYIYAPGLAPPTHVDVDMIVA